MTFDALTRPQLEAELRRCNDVMVADGATIAALTAERDRERNRANAHSGDVNRLAAERETLKAQIEELHQQDRLKTREINTLVPENRNLLAQRDELRAELTYLVTLMTNQDVQVSRPGVNISDFLKEARATLAKTAPPNPNADVVQASPRGRWTT